MALRCHRFVVFLLMAAVVSLAFSPLLTQVGVAGRHLPRTSFAVTASLTIFQPISEFFSLSAPTAEAHITRSPNLIELNCVRLC
jgi:hypothetical protein